jgi:prepilin-type N-terminal cleavage/methylation domain-containing protein
MKYPRRGHSLIEVMVVIALLGVLLSATGVCLHGLYRVDQQARQAVGHAAAVDRLLLQFRADAHTAVEVNVLQARGERPPGIVFTERDGRKVEYGQQGRYLVRTVTHGDAVVHRDGYRLQPGTVTKWRVEGQTPVIASIDVIPDGQPGGARPGHCEAVVGLIQEGEN